MCSTLLFEILCVFLKTITLIFVGTSSDAADLVLANTSTANDEGVMKKKKKTKRRRIRTEEYRAAETHGEC